MHAKAPAPTEKPLSSVPKNDARALAEFYVREEAAGRWSPERGQMLLMYAEDPDAVREEIFRLRPTRI